MRVIGVLAERGTQLAMNMDDVVFVPVATGMKIFNRHSLFRILIKVHSFVELDPVCKQVVGLMTERHGEEDITCVTQAAVVSTFSTILKALTLGLAAIGAISLSVAGVGVMNVMLMAVSDRTEEVGLLKSLGAKNRQILMVFLTEATLLTLAGGLIGLALGYGTVAAMTALYPAIPASTPLWASGICSSSLYNCGNDFWCAPGQTSGSVRPRPSHGAPNVRGMLKMAASFVLGLLSGSRTFLYVPHAKSPPDLAGGKPRLGAAGGGG